MPDTAAETPQQAAYGVAATIADKLLQAQYPLTGFDTFDQGHMVSFCFDVGGLGFREWLLVKVPTEAATADLVAEQFRLKAA